jgi:acetoin:2,6-dichlorophenolindophenol oxidoreductase subunit alpha
MEGYFILTAEFKLKLLTDMLKIRVFEEKVRALDVRLQLYGPIHLYVGEEACAVGACSALNNDDYIVSTHRGHGHLIAKGGDFNKAMAEILAKETGYNKGKGGSMHIADVSIGMLGANGIVGANIPIATGAAFSAKYFNNGRVSVCFMGDAATNEGTFHESLNIASAFNLPIVYVCENNLYGISTLQTKVRNVESIANRAVAYGMYHDTVDGNDPEAVFHAIKKAVDLARDNNLPSLIECKTYRHYAHHTIEKDNYRPKEEIEHWKQNDPIKLYLNKLIEQGIITEDEFLALKKDLEKQANEAVSFAKASPNPPLSSALEDIYSD